MCDRAHAKGMLLYPTLLVQQGRGPWAEDVRCSNFRFDNPQLEIGAGGGSIAPSSMSMSNCISDSSMFRFCGPGELSGIGPAGDCIGTGPAGDLSGGGMAGDFRG